MSTDLSRYISDAQEVITFVLVYKWNDVQQHDGSRLTFKPVMTHQIFDRETIFGYRNLRIQIYYLAHSAHVYIDLQYDEMITEDGLNKIKADDLYELLSPWFPNNFTRSLSDFRELFSREKPNQFYGTTVSEFGNINRDGNGSKYMVTNCITRETGLAEFHDRFQSLITFFIDAANFIQLSDEKWMLLYLYEVRPLEKGKMSYYPVGFCTVYKFFAFPDKVRARISQFFILPPYQRLGLGYKFLNAVNDVLCAMSNIKDITVECPNEIFRQMRDNLDALRLSKLAEFQPVKLNRGYSEVMYNVGNSRFKLNARQIRRVYEILRYFYSMGDEERLQSFKDDFKQRRHVKYKTRYNRRVGFGEHGDDLDNLISASVDSYQGLEEDFLKFTINVRNTVQYLQQFLNI